MTTKQAQTPGSPAHDTYDLAVGLRRRLAEVARPESVSVTSQLQFAARARLGSGGSVGGRFRFRSRSPRRSDNG
jgi:hypothetical protein